MGNRISPPTQRHFTLADQVHQLVSASEADPERGFMARMMALCSLPRSNPGNRKEYALFPEVRVARLQLVQRQMKLHDEFSQVRGSSGVCRTLASAVRCGSRGPGEQHLRSVRPVG